MAEPAKCACGAERPECDHYECSRDQHALLSRDGTMNLKRKGAEKFPAPLGRAVALPWMTRAWSGRYCAGCVSAPGSADETRSSSASCHAVKTRKRIPHKFR